MYANIGGPTLQLTPGSVWIVILTSLAGVAITLLWYHKADQSR
jgi:hypothetical protein